jgi:AcrR family transcriptional regulator
MSVGAGVNPCTLGAEAMVITSAQAEERRRALIDAAIAVMSEQGVSQSRLVDIGRRAGISPSQVLYYFNSKAELFIEALRAVEHELRDDFLAATERLPRASERLEYLLEAAAPTGPGDYRLLLWMDAWELAPRNPEVARQLQQLEDDWTGLLSDLVHHGIARAEFKCEDVPAFVLRYSALIDGLTIQVVLGSPHVDRAGMLEICRDTARRELSWTTAPSA